MPARHHRQLRDSSVYWQEVHPRRLCTDPLSGKPRCAWHDIGRSPLLTTADLDPGTDLDMLDAFEKLIPHLNYRHPHNPAHVPDHILASLIGPSLVLPLENGESSPSVGAIRLPNSENGASRPTIRPS